jgi:hypothetical protein
MHIYMVLHALVFARASVSDGEEAHYNHGTTEIFIDASLARRARANAEVKLRRRALVTPRDQKAQIPGAATTSRSGSAPAKLLRPADCKCVFKCGAALHASLCVSAEKRQISQLGEIERAFDFVSTKKNYSNSGDFTSRERAARTELNLQIIPSTFSAV